MNLQGVLRKNQEVLEMKMKNIFAKLRSVVLSDCKEMLFADCSEKDGVFLILYRDGLGRKCVISFRREESHE